MAATKSRLGTSPRGGAAGGPRTLAIDIGGSGLKATVLDAAGTELVEHVRIPTTYPCPPQDMVAALVSLVANLPGYDRISVGFPGVVRRGQVRTAPHFITRSGPGSPVVPELLGAWTGFALAAALQTALGKPVRLANDADMQGSAVVSGQGLEVVLTLGTGLGSAVFLDGELVCHLELAHHPFQKGQNYNQRIGDAARRQVGDKKWNRRVRAALVEITALLVPDHVYIGGGNSARIEGELGPGVSLVSNEAGLLGGVTLWATPTP